MDRFPDNFMWGASTSAYQVEGGNRWCDWWEWENTGASEPSGAACEQYERFREDFRMAAEMGHNAHRLGIEWSRLEKREGQWDAEVWQHYREVLHELRALKIEPVLTLHHFTLPRWLADEGGWLSSRAPYLFTEFVKRAVRELGDYVTRWITINEPNILAMLAYRNGEWPPCETDTRKMVKALLNMVKAHRSAYSAIKAVASGRDAEVGIAKAVTAFHPCRRYSLPDRLAAFACAKSHNLFFCEASLRGKSTLDFIGLNYYFRQFIRAASNPFSQPLGNICPIEEHPEAGPVTDMGWEIYPKGLYEVAKQFKRFNLPIIITENGLATTEDHPVRVDFIREHLRWLLKAVVEDVPVVGYLHWSLMDNFEWAHGYSKKFGLVEVDFESQKRIPRPSARYYSKVIEQGRP